jgi:hypothetical protein
MNGHKDCGQKSVSEPVLAVPLHHPEPVNYPADRRAHRLSSDQPPPCPKARLQPRRRFFGKGVGNAMFTCRRGHAHADVSMAPTVSMGT